MSSFTNKTPTKTKEKGRRHEPPLTLLTYPNSSYNKTVVARMLPTLLRICSPRHLRTKLYTRFFFSLISLCYAHPYLSSLGTYNVFILFYWTVPWRTSLFNLLQSPINPELEPVSSPVTLVGRFISGVLLLSLTNPPSNSNPKVIWLWILVVHSYSLFISPSTHHVDVEVPVLSTPVCLHCYLRDP